MMIKKKRITAALLALGLGAVTNVFTVSGICC